MIPSSNMQASVVTAAAPVLQIQQARRIPGYVYGLRAPSVVARISVEDPARGRVIAQRARQALSFLIPLDVPKNVDSARADDAALVVGCLAHLIQSLQEAAGLPQAGAAYVTQISANKAAARSQAPQHWLLALPTTAATPTIQALQWTVRYFNDVAASDGDVDVCEDGRAGLELLLKEMHRHAPPGSNNLFFIQAAYRLGIPCVPLPGKIYQYGWGRHSRWLDSSFTQDSSNISTRLARSKLATNNLLRQAGLPVPAQIPVRTIEDAVRAAGTLGYPVVVKPADRDGGVGVSAGIGAEDELRSAFERAKKCSPNLLIEKHLEGQDYRVYVFRGRAFAAMTRAPASVTGDGASTVAALVERVNLDPRRGRYPAAPLTRIELDQEALELLASQGLTTDSAPEAGRCVVLRRSSNVSTGGMPTAISDRMHPDNARLCERAAQILRLDLAGIDLLMPDISRSWKEVGAGIFEVNAQPQISSVALREKFALVMSELIERQGRIPVALVLTAGPDASVAHEAADLLEQRKLCVGVTSNAGLRIGAQGLRNSQGDVLKDVHALVIDPSVEAIIIATDGAQLRSQGLPLDRFDVLVVAGSAANRATDPAAADLRSMLRMIKPHCPGAVLAVADQAAATIAAEVFGPARLQLASKSGELPAALARALLAG